MKIVDGRTLNPPIWWQPGVPGCRARKEPIRAVVHHWTGGSRGAQGVAQTLRARKLSIHYVVELDGRVVQCADHSTVTYHAGSANAWSIGVEIVGGPKSNFTPAQYRAIAALAESLPVPRVLYAKGADLATFSGHLEHKHVKATKPDAGERVMQALAAMWQPPL